jgi:predicted transcriptional regulator
MNNTTKKGNPLKFRITPNVRRRLDRLARKTATPITFQVHLALTAGLPRLEVRYKRELKRDETPPGK